MDGLAENPGSLASSNVSASNQKWTQEEFDAVMQVMGGMRTAYSGQVEHGWRLGGHVYILVGGEIWEFDREVCGPWTRTNTVRY